MTAYTELLSRAPTQTAGWGKICGCRHVRLAMILRNNATYIPDDWSLRPPPHGPSRDRRHFVDPGAFRIFPYATPQPDHITRLR